MEDSRYAPLVLFVYNRPAHTRKVLESINNLLEAVRTDLIIFSDAPKTDQDIHSVNEVRILLGDFQIKSHFSNIKVVESSINKGLAKSIIEGVSDVIGTYGKAIVLEDDLLVAPDFLRYMNDALDFYEKSPKIWSISAYTFDLNSLDSYTHDIYITGRGCSWGWATWVDRWNMVDWDVKDYTKFKFNIKERNKFGLDGRDMPLMLDAFMYGEVKSWAIRWCYSAFKNGKYTVYPKQSRVVNIGTDGSGTNYTTTNSDYDTTMYEGDKDCVFEEVEMNEKIRKEFRNRFMSGFSLFKARIRWSLIKIGIIKSKR